MLRNFLDDLKNTLILTWHIIISPKKGLTEAVDNPKGYWYSFILLIISGLVFMPPLILAAIFLRPEGWLPLWIRFVPEDMLYVYFAATAPFSFILIIIAIGCFVFSSVLRNKYTANPKDIFTTLIFSLIIVTIFDIFIELIAIIYFFVNFNHQVFPTWLLVTMFFGYGMLFIWDYILLRYSYMISCKETNPVLNIIIPMLTNIIYWACMGIWIA